eukprot:TRINITY_DN15661_c0_g1_i1.p1 TRINITY_DN15661_c0_g1~~TRINITY_DN15661_c0_g1_i1.p1  ORF type:complete len:119 (-),score=21.55 TRINITY_DN15661_c0_g1_i1:168-524(-)
MLPALLVWTFFKRAWARVKIKIQPFHSRIIQESRLANNTWIFLHPFTKHAKESIDNMTNCHPPAWFGKKARYGYGDAQDHLGLLYLGWRRKDERERGNGFKRVRGDGREGQGDRERED